MKPALGLDNEYVKEARVLFVFCLARANESLMVNSNLGRIAETGMNLLTLS